MDYKLAKEIYSTAWFVDPLSFMSLSKTLEAFQNGMQIDKDAAKSNSYGYYDVLSNSQITTTSTSKTNSIPEDSIAIYNFDSVITKYGGMSHNGTKDIAAQFKKMEANESIIGHLFYVESGGGSANAIKFIREVSNKSDRTKPLVTYAEDIMASAAMYIASDSDYIYANSKDAIVGSIGTMIELEGFKSGEEDKTGKRHMRIYASQSVDKNKEFESAINDFDFELIKKNMLDPHCEEFINDMKANRPNITAEQTTGKVFNASDCVGTLIDGIGTFDMAIEKVKELSSTNSNNLKNRKMNVDELKAKHPEVFEEVFNSGVTTEKNRVDSFMVFNDIASDKVKAGIESGEPMTDAQKLTFLRMSQKSTLQADLESESKETGEVMPNAESAKVLTEEQKADAKVEAELKAHLNIEE